MYKLREMLMKELKEVTDKGELTAGSLDVIDKLTHSIKSIDTIMAMEGSSHDGYSYDDGYSRRGRKRDSMGRYSRDDGYSRRGYYGGSSYEGYSRDEAKHELTEGLKDLEKSAPDESTRHMIKEWMRQLEG